MDENLKKSLKKHYESFSLSKSQMLMLNSRRDWKTPAALGFSAAAIAAFFFVTIFNQPLVEKIASEVSYNHRKDMPPEVLSQDIGEINEALDKLDFKLVSSQRLGKNYIIVGGRYCSIRGKIAAQLKLKHQVTGEFATLYQYKQIQNFDQTIEANSVVQLWSEGEIGFALATDKLSE